MFSFVDKNRVQDLAMQQYGSVGKTSAMEEVVEVKGKRKSPLKIVVLVCLVGLLGFVIVDSVTTGYVKKALSNFLEVVEGLGFVGYLLYALVYIIATVALLPASILTIGAGFLFTKTNNNDQLAGTFIATLVVFFGASIGATLAFLLSRFLLRDTVSKYTEQYRTFGAINKAIGQNGFKIVFLLRLSPAIPFNILNYLLGTTPISAKEYMAACFGLLPGVVAFCFIGSSLGSLSDVENGGKNSESDSGSTVKLILLIVGGIASILAVVVITKFAKKELAKHLDVHKTDESLA